VSSKAGREFYAIGCKMATAKVLMNGGQLVVEGVYGVRWLEMRSFSDTKPTEYLTQQFVGTELAGDSG
jgi:hypothetical protein